MIVCFSNKDNKVVKTISGANEIPPYSEEISFISIENNNVLIKRGDEVRINKEDGYVKVGYAKFPIINDGNTIITDENCDKPIYLEQIA